MSPPIARGVTFAVAVVCMAVAMPEPATAQRPHATGVQAWRDERARGSAGAPLPEPRRAAPRRPGVNLALAPLASAVVPGLGQAMLGQDRTAAYLAAEIYLWAQYMTYRSELLEQRRAYRDLARGVARVTLSPTGPDGDWDYYEVMARWLESGAYSRAEAGPFIPESDTATYNGWMWTRAQRLYGIDPAQPAPTGSAGYARAVAYYQAHAVTDAQRWSWRNALLERDLYRRAIGLANDSFRRATLARSALIANHLLSTVDAFTTWRLSTSISPSGVTHITATVPIPAWR